MSYFQLTRPKCKIASFYTTGRQKKTDCFKVDEFCFRCHITLKAMGCFYFFVPLKMYVLVSLKKLPNEVAGEKSSMNSDEVTYRINVSLSLKCGSVGGGALLKNISEKMFLTCYVQSDVEIHEVLRANFANLPPIFKKILIRKKVFVGPNERLCRRRSNNVSTSENVDIEFQITKRKSDYSSAVVLSATGLFITKVHRSLE